MDKPEKRWLRIIKWFHSPRAMSGLIVVAIVLSIPFTVSMVQKFRDLRQRADAGVVQSPATQNTTGVAYPWNSHKSGKKSLPVIPVSTRALLSTVPFSSAACSKKSQGDADCNNVIDQGDLSYWQIDYTGKTAKFADFNRDGKVTIADYNIWRQHAGISPTPALQKVVENMGLGKLLSFVPWNRLSIDSFHAIAADATSSTAVTDSTVNSTANGTSTVTTTYADNSYSVQTVSPTTGDANANYYNSTGDLMAQVTNFLQNLSTTVMQVGNTTVSVSTDTSGSIMQTITDSNGSFLASQIWTNQQSYASGQPPSAATIATTNGYVTLSVQPNNGSIVTQKDNQGNLVEKMQIGANGTVTVENYLTNTKAYANKQFNLIILTVRNNLGGTTAYTIYFDHLTSITQTDNRGNTYVETVVIPTGDRKDYKWNLVTTDQSGNSTQRIVDDPMWAIYSLAPSPEQIMLTFEQFKKRFVNPNTLFTDAFQVRNSQTRAADTFTAVSSVQAPTTTVLGVSTGPVKTPTKAILGQTTGNQVVGSEKPSSNPGTAFEASNTVFNVVNQSGQTVSVVSVTAVVAENGIRNENGTTNFGQITVVDAAGNRTDTSLTKDARDSLVDSGLRTIDPTKQVDIDAFGSIMHGADPNLSIPGVSSTDGTQQQQHTAPAQQQQTAPAQQQQAPAQQQQAPAQQQQTAPAQTHGSGPAGSSNPHGGIDSGAGNSASTQSPAQAAAAAVSAANPTGTNQNAVFNGYTAGMAAFAEAKAEGLSDEQATSIGQSAARDAATNTTGVGGVAGQHGSKTDGDAAAAAVTSKIGNPTSTAEQALTVGGLTVGQNPATDPTTAANTAAAAAEAAGRAAQATFGNVATAAAAGGASVSISVSTNGVASLSVQGGQYGDATITQNANGNFNVTRGSGPDQTTVEGFSVNGGQGIATDRSDPKGSCVAGNCGSFLAGTLIDTPNGTIVIEKLKAGDSVYSYNETTQKKEISVISSVFTHEIEEYLVINGHIKTTTSHPFYVLAHGSLELRDADHLQKGDLLFRDTTHTESVASIVSVHKKVPVYNLVSVSPNDNFYAEGVLVHNCDSLSNEIDNAPGGSYGPSDSLTGPGSSTDPENNGNKGDDDPNRETTTPASPEAEPAAPDQPADQQQSDQQQSSPDSSEE